MKMKIKIKIKTGNGKHDSTLKKLKQIFLNEENENKNKNQQNQEDQENQKKNSLLKLFPKPFQDEIKILQNEIEATQNNNNNNNTENVEIKAADFTCFLQYLGQQIETNWLNFLKKSNANTAIRFLQAKHPDDFNRKLFKKIYLSFIKNFHKKKKKLIDEKNQENEEQNQNLFEEELEEFEQKIDKDLEQVK
jgi:hypothetical protein